MKNNLTIAKKNNSNGTKNNQHARIKKIKRLLDGNVSIKEIARITGISRNTIKKYRKLGINDP